MVSVQLVLLDNYKLGSYLNLIMSKTGKLDALAAEGTSDPRSLNY